MIARRLGLGTLGVLCALAGAVVLGVSGASAALTHEFLPGVSAKLNEGVPAVGPHGETVPAPGRFASLGGTGISMTVDSGELYVADGSVASRIDRFDASSGAFLAQLPQVSAPSHLYQGVVVGRSTGEAQTYVAGDEFPGGTAHGAVAVFGSAGGIEKVWSGVDTPSGAFGAFESSFGMIAVDESSGLGDWAAGDVYVVDSEDRVVDVFRPEAGGGEEYVTRLEGPEAPGSLFGAPAGVAVEQSTGEVLVTDTATNVVDVFKPAAIAGQYEFVGQLSGPRTGESFGRLGGLAVDRGDGDIYIDEATGPGQSRVDQFNANGEFIGQLTGTPTGLSGTERPFGDVTNLTVDPASHDVYVSEFITAEQVNVVDVFGPNIVIPDVTTGAASGVTSMGESQSEATLNGTVNPDGEGEASCRFAWGTSGEFGQVAPCEPERVAEGEAPVPVHARLTGLQADTTYHYRLQATNKNGTNPGEASQDQEFTTPGPGLHGEAVSAVRAESVTFDAKINPHGAPTSYYFQYGTSSTYGSDAPALSEAAKYGAAIGSGEGDVEVSRHVQGLSGQTVYHYRVVAVSELAPGEFEHYYGPDQMFTTQAVGLPLQLPDGRAWEMVSPPQKEGVLLGHISEGVIQASSKGDAFTDWTSFEPTEGAAAGAYGFYVPVFFGRGADGWVSKTIAPPHSGPGSAPVGNGQEYRFFSEDLSKGVLQPFGLFTPLAPGVTESTPYLRTDFLNGNPGELCTTDCYQPFVSAANVPPGTKFGGEPTGECTSVFCGPRFLGGTPDLDHVVLESPAALTSTPTEAYVGLYEWGEGRLQLVNLLPEGESNEHGGPVGIGAKLGNDDSDATHAISGDGSRIIWEAGKQFSQHLYLRDTVKGETIRLDVFQGVEKGPEANYVIKYMTASSDGSRVFFLDGERLTTDSTANPLQPDLYEYNMNAVVGSRLTDLSVADKPQEAANVIAVPGVSEDGSYVYLVAPGALASGAVPGKCSVQPSPDETQLCNLYVRHAGKTTFIASLSQEDAPDWARRLDRTTDRVSPDGRWFAFMSDRHLTGYDTTDAVSKHPDEEVYLYDAVNNKLTCASCNPTGARPVGVKYDSNEQIVAADTVFNESTWVASNVPPWTRFNLSESRYQSRYLSDSGRLFFDSNDALVPQDVNGTQDVYEYEPAGVGDCSPSSLTFSERSGGCAAPVSSGTSNEESAFLDASETGSDVFFLTGAKLLQRDFDNQLDVYDAHECTASMPCFAPVPAAPPACDTGESCKPAQSAQPTLFGSPSSATFSGTGNVSESASGPAVGPRSLTRKQKLARAIQTCHRRKKRRQRVACEWAAKHRYHFKAAASRTGNSINHLSGQDRALSARER